MKKNSVNTFCMEVCENTFEEITIVSTLISTIQELCLNLEMNAQYYEASNYINRLSEERNKYINLSSMALQRLKKIESLNTELENVLT